jgi:hypothetical protein
MVIGIDFDNTIVRYDEVFRDAAVAKGLIPVTIPANKSAVRDFLRNQGREDAWTELQGFVYGKQMSKAQAFPGVKEFIARGISTGRQIYIISHKTPTPAVGPAYDLQGAAFDWLKQQGFIEPSLNGLPLSHVLFGATREEKIKLIRRTRCTHFIDDLEEVFREECFPQDIVKILFSPNQIQQPTASLVIATSWPWISEFLLNAAN